jgi:hypothetical protein
MSLTDEYMAMRPGALYSLVSRNIKLYIHRLYILQLIHRLTEKYKLYSSV